MKLERDMELIFSILKKVTSSDIDEVTFQKIEIDGYDNKIVGYHLYLMEQASLVKIVCPKSMKGPIWDRIVFNEITWEGHEFLDALKNDTVYSKFKKVLNEKGKSIPFKVAEELLLKLSSAHFLSGF